MRLAKPEREIVDGAERLIGDGQAFGFGINHSEGMLSDAGDRRQQPQHDRESAEDARSNRNVSQEGQRTQEAHGGYPATRCL